MQHVYQVKAWIRGSDEPETVTLFNCPTPALAKDRALAMLRAEAGIRGASFPDVVRIRVRQQSDDDSADSHDHSSQKT